MVNMKMYVLYVAELNNNNSALDWDMLNSVYFETPQEADLARIVCTKASKNKIFTYREINE